MDTNQHEAAVVALRAYRKSEVGSGGTLRVYGSGPVVQFIGQWAKASGIKNVVVDDEGMVEIPGTGGFEACIECKGRSKSLAVCIALAKPGGRGVCVGSPAENIDFTQDIYLQIRQKELTLVGVSVENVRDTDEWQEVADAVNVGRIVVEV